MKTAGTIKNKKYVILFFALALLCGLFPYTGDDWAWGSSIGIERLSTMFEGYSGRYLGNFIVLLLTRSNILKTAAMALTITAVVKCVEVIGRSGYSFCYACLMLLLTPKLIFRQAIVWTAGFSNYCTSVALVLIFLIFAVKDPEIREKKRARIYAAGLLLLGFANSLIVEHITLYSVILAAGLCVYSLATDKRNIAQYAAYFTGAAAGAAVMFSNSVYHNISAGNDDYRSMAGTSSIINRAYSNYTDTIYFDGFFNNMFLNLSLLAIALLLYRKIRADRTAGTKLMKWMTLCLAVFAVFVIYSTFARVSFAQGDQPHALELLDAVFAFAALAAFLGYVIMAGYLNGDLRRVIILSLSITMIIAPLFVVTPIGSRCFFATYVLFILLGCVMLDYTGADTASSDMTVKIALTAILTLYCVYLAVFSVISITNKDRLDRAREAAAAGKKEVVFTILPFDSFLWTAAPTEGIWAERYKLFYGLPDDLTIIVKDRKG